MHNIELSTTVVNIDIKVISASFSQNKCLQCVTPPLMHVEISRLRDATELNSDGMIKLGDVQYQTEPNLSSFSKSHLINEDSSFCSQILLTDLQCHVFTFGQILLNVRLCL